MPVEIVKNRLITVFERWGKCGAMRVDNGEPLGSPGRNTTSILALWLIANDIDMIFNKPYCPQCNAKVERMQDISARWAEIHSVKNITELQRRLDNESRVQREIFAVTRLDNKTRIETFPELETSRRVFIPELFDENRVYAFLSKKIYVRLITKAGQMTHFGQQIFIGTSYKGQYVEIKLDPIKCQWNVFIGDKYLYIFTLNLIEFYK